jgi:hypothetical protein
MYSVADTFMVTARNPNPPLQMASNFKLSKVGFPIRKFTDQSSFAAPRDLSQRTTSFIASNRLGIHQMLLGHLIALICNIHQEAPITPGTSPSVHSTSISAMNTTVSYRKTSFHQDEPTRSNALTRTTRPPVGGPRSAIRNRLIPSSRCHLTAYR